MNDFFSNQFEKCSKTIQPRNIVHVLIVNEFGVLQTIRD